MALIVADETLAPAANIPLAPSLLRRLMTTTSGGLVYVGLTILYCVMFVTVIITVISM